MILEQTPETNWQFLPCSKNYQKENKKTLIVATI
jgi:hypothetical protein